MSQLCKFCLTRQLGLSLSFTVGYSPKQGFSLTKKCIGVVIFYFGKSAGHGKNVAAYWL